MYIVSVKDGDSIISVAKLMLMIEMGKRLYEDGIEVKDPKPFNVYNNGYCDISMQYNTGYIFIIAPNLGDTAVDKYILSFVNSVDAELRRIQQPLTSMSFPGSIFSKDETTVTHASVSIVSENYSFVPRRVFKFNSAYAGLASFTWDICAEFPSYIYGIQNGYDWIHHQNGIIVDYTGMFSSVKHRQIASTNSIDMLTEIGILDSERIIYFSQYQDKKYMPTKIRDRGRMVYSIKIRSLTMSKFKLFTADMTNMDFTDMKEDTDAVCQSCGEQLVNPYAYGLNINKTDAVGICALCAIRDGAVYNVSAQYPLSKIDCGRDIKYECKSTYGISYMQLHAIQQSLGAPDWGALSICSNIVIIKQCRDLSYRDISALSNMSHRDDAIFVVV